MSLNPIFISINKVRKESVIFDGTIDCSKKQVSVLVVHLENDENSLPKPIVVVVYMCWKTG